MKEDKYDCILEEIADVIDCEHKTAPVVDQSEFYSVRTSNISNGKIDFDGSNRVSKETYFEWTKRGVPEEGDLILAREAPVGEVGIVKNGYKVCLGQRTVLIKVTSEKVDRHYLLYYLVNPETKYDLQVRSVGSVVSHLNMKDIRAFELSLPPLPEQKAIAAVLSSLDDKIDLLHRQNKTLEAMGEVQFREWFVEGAEEDWEEGCLGDLVEIKYGKDHKKLLDGQIPVYGSGGIMRYAEKALYEEESVLVPRKGTLNNVIYINQPFWTVDTMFFTIMKKKNLAKFIYYFLNTKDLAGMNVGSAVPSMTTAVLNNMPLLIPSDIALEQFEQTVNPFFEKMNKNQAQIHTLEQLRDTLLPKLMSGEVRVEI
jgi:type I restriction enzyme S subunit